MKVPQFSFMRLSGADPVLGVEMLSTGEVACLGENFSDAFSKALRSAEFSIPDRDGSVFISVGGSNERKKRVVPIAQAFVELGFKIYATDHTADVLSAAGVAAVKLFKVKEAGATPNVLDYLQERKIDLVINVPMANQADQHQRHLNRRLHHPAPSSRIQRARHHEPAVRRRPCRRAEA